MTMQIRVIQWDFDAWEEHRLVYVVEDSAVVIISCRGHYDD